MYEAMRLPADAPVAEVFARANALAKKLAPDTRKLWKWILMLEGVAVLLPMLWLLVMRLAWTPAYTAFAVMACTLLVVGVCWYLRWRGMQHTWTRARMLAEIGRSAQSTAWVPGRAAVEALAGAPSLQAVAAAIPEQHEGTLTDLDAIKKRYLKDRILDQMEYYTEQRRNAAEDRRRISNTVTYSLDGALFLAVAGVALAWSGRAEYLMQISGVDYLLGMLGMSLPLVAILMQSLSSYLELGRRTGRYAQQISFLKAAEDRMNAVQSRDEALALIHQTEGALLGEVVEWFYQADQAEVFYRPQNLDESETIHAAVASVKQSWVRRFLSSLVASASFIIAVLFKRVVVAAVAVVVTMAGIAYLDKISARSSSQFRACDGCLLSHCKAVGWEPNKERVERGFVLIAHGLKDGANLPGDTNRWMDRLQKAIEGDLKEASPEICLVDWHDAAGRPTMSPDMLSSLAAIRPQAEEIGKLVGCKLAMAIRLGKLNPERPMHFIGHSAGGFVIMSAARSLKILGIELKNLRLSVLDTPAPDMDQQGDLSQILSWCPIDYYCTSFYAKGVPENQFHPNFSRFDIPVPEEKGMFNGAHSHAYEWLIESIGNNDPRGFARSPFKSVAVK